MRAPKRTVSLLLAAALLLALSLLTGCAQIDEAEEPLFPPEEDPAPEETAAALPSAFSLPYLAGQPLNPLTCPDGMQQTAASLLYEGLFHLDGQFTPQPLLCASYTYDPEALTYVLTLRQGVVFSDGSPLTAADIKATLTAARSSARYAPRLADVKSISAGNGTVTLTLSRPNSALPALLDIPILKSGTEKKDIPTGTGPYLYDESSTPCLLASQNWWQGGGQPVERIVLTETADAESMLYRFTSHDVQLLVSDLTGTDSVTVSGSVRCTDADTTVFQYLGINTTVKPLDDAAFRRCLSLGLNRQALVSGLLSGHARAAQFPVSPVSPLYPSELDTAFSATAFADALAACETCPTRTLRLVVNSENAFKVSVAHQIAATFTTSGIPMEAVSLPWAEYTAALAAGRFDLYYGEVRLLADWDVSSLLATSGSLNYGGWSDAQCNQLLEACRSSAGRETALNALYRYLREQTPILPVCFKTVSALYESDVLEGLTPTAAEPFYDLNSCVIHLSAG
mgnify:FL=1